MVGVHDCIHDEIKGTLYLVMEFIHGQTLEDYVAKHFPPGSPS